MVRQNAYARASLAAASIPTDPERNQLRQSVARVGRVIGRVLLAPFALVTGAVAGLVFVILLPVCGIASVAEATARSSWALVRDTFRRPRAAESHR
jgi:hypothetical protein